ncbi:ABC transporter ATP-binding protein [Traorella massiliensis]|uniref:ABC transporter ATP-binding protein n=1 Tax=Traorella massiliensis TaxID=1903263 RepID=UPI0008F970CF|nr:ABC transporter ATP-binding protein [Traorella massiliensis]
MARQITTAKPKDMKKTLLSFLQYMGHYKYSLFVVGIFVIISTGVNLWGTFQIRTVVNDYILALDAQGFIRFVMLMAIVYALGALSTAIYKQLMVHTAQKIVKDIRQDLFNKMQKLPLKYFDSNAHGDLMSRFTNDLDTVQDAMNNCFDNLIQSFMMITGTLILIFVLNWQLSVIVLISMIFMYFLIQYFSRRSRYYFKRQQKALGNLNGFIEEMVNGVKVVKVFNHEEKNLEEFDKRNHVLLDAAVKALRYSGKTIPTVVSISYINYAIVACVGGFMAIGGLIDLGSLSSYLVFVRQTALPINQFTQQLNFLLAAMAGAERIFEMMAEKEEIDEGKVTLTCVEEKEGQLSACSYYTGKWAWKHPRPDNTYELIPLRGDVRFHDVEFGYDSDHMILKKISLFAKPGQKIAFVGSTGAGKTTITNLINRFYDVQKGSITYDGIDVRLIKKADLRKSISIVLQDTHLFTGTIADNIRYGKLDASMDEVIAAAKLANAHSFIKRLPNGYNTMLTSDGANLSQGQRQLLAIARAAIANPPVLILDEATSSIDTRTEKLIEKGMDRLMENRTVFVIAHRLSTVRNSAAIMVLDHGKIIERGSHEELLEQKGRYYQLYTGQFELE